VASDPSVPLPLVLITIPLTLLAGIKPASILRSE
jgi:hypothetical protein